MPLNRKEAVDLVLADWRVRLTCRHDPERIGRIADKVWATCSMLRQGEGTIFPPGVFKNKKYLNRLVMAQVQIDPKYDDMVSFIPVWAVIVLKIIISILLEYWLLNEGASV